MVFGAEIDNVVILVMTATMRDPGVRVEYVPEFPDSVSVKLVDVRAYTTIAIIIIARSFRLPRQASSAHLS